MGTTIKALISLAIVVILFLIIIRFKIKSDKKRKSLAIPSVEREKNYPYNETIKPKEKKSFLSTILSALSSTPSVALAILTFVGTSLLILTSSEGKEIIVYHI